VLEPGSARFPNGIAFKREAGKNLMLHPYALT